MASKELPKLPRKKSPSDKLDPAVHAKILEAQRLQREMFDEKDGPTDPVIQAKLSELKRKQNP